MLCSKFEHIPVTLLVAGLLFQPLESICLEVVIASSMCNFICLHSRLSIICLIVSVLDMKPKTRKELRSVYIDSLYKFMKEHDDLLEFERLYINEALKMLVIADSHVSHLGVSHSVAFRLEKENCKL